jgi:hypothetical protein
LYFHLSVLFSLINVISCHSDRLCIILIRGPPGVIPNSQHPGSKASLLYFAPLSIYDIFYIYHLISLAKNKAGIKKAPAGA